MNRTSLQKLRLDLRLAGRPDWISNKELASELEALPDASHKATTLGNVEDEAKGAAAPAASGEPSPAA